MTPSIIFDFDGTLAIGHGPVLAYARLIAPDAAPGFLDRVQTELDKYDAGASPYRDGYDIVATLADAEGVSAESKASAYTQSRTLLGTDQAPVDAMPKLEAFLIDLGTHAHLVLATNAPEEGVDRVLDNWGVHDRFDARHYRVGKPAGLTPIIETALRDGPVLAIGDIVEYDLAPALDLGADTALVGATASITTTTGITMRGSSLASIQTEIRRWATAAAAHSTTPQTTLSGR